MGRPFTSADDPMTAVLDDDGWVHSVQPQLPMLMFRRATSRLDAITHAAGC